MKVRGSLTNAQGEENFELQFTDEERDALKRYVTDCEKLLSSSFLKSPENLHLSLQMTQENSSVTSGTINEEHWYAFLHLFRPLTGLNRDRSIYGFTKITALVSRQARQSPGLTKRLKDIKARFECEQMPYQITVGVAGKTYSALDVFDLWMNAREYHRDDDKEAVVAAATRIIAPDALRNMIAHMVFEKAAAIAELRHFVLLLFSAPGTEVPLSPHHVT